MTTEQESSALDDKEIRNLARAGQKARDANIAADVAEGLIRTTDELKRLRSLAKKLQSLATGGVATLNNPANQHAMQIIARKMLQGGEA